MKSEYPLISIVTPSYNSVKYIEDCILSVLNQNYPSFEHIIVDGGSTDGTIEVLKKYSHLKWISEPDKGMTNALNKSFLMTNGSIIGWLNSDDYYDRNVFQEVISQFRNTHFDVIYANFTFIDEQKSFVKKFNSVKPDMNILLYYGCYIPSTTTFFSKRIFNEQNYLDEDYKVCMDKEFFTRLMKLNYKFKHVNKNFAFFRLRTDNLGKLDQRYWPLENEKILNKYSYIYDFIKKYKLKKVLFYIFGLKKYIYAIANNFKTK